MEPEQQYQFEADLWLYAGAKAAWHFITVPADISRSLRFYAGSNNGFGSIRVRVRIGENRWETSVFPDKASGCYFLPVKAAVRKAERVSTGDRVKVELSTV